MIVMSLRQRRLCWVFVALAVFHAPIRSGSAAMPAERELGKIKSNRLNEISGVAASRCNPNVLWMHNDGDSGIAYGVSKTGKLVALVRSPIRIEDIEDIAIGPGPEAGTDYLYLADIGDNDSRRREIRIIRFPEPLLAGQREEQIKAGTAEEFRLVYPDGPHNAEALFVDPAAGDLFVVTKEKGRARLYTIAADHLTDNALATLEFAGNVGAMDVSGGDISSDGSRIVLRREDLGWLWDRASGEGIAAALQRPPRIVPVRGDRQGQNGEAITFSPGGNSYYTVSEGKKQAICEFPLPGTAATGGR